MIKNEIALTNLQDTFHRLYDDEIPSFIDTLKSTQNLPIEINSTIKTVEENIEKSRTLLAPELGESPFKDAALLGLALGGVVGGVAGGIFSKLSKKKAAKKLSGEKLVAIQDSASLFEDTIKRMEQLLEKTEGKDGFKRNYEKLTASEKLDLLSLSERMKKLSEELNEHLAA